MNLDQFFEALPRDGWYLTNGDLRRPIPENPGCSACPISSISKSFQRADRYGAAAQEIRLDVDLIAPIMWAADRPDYQDSPAVLALRRRLYQHCGVEGPIEACD